MSAVIKKIEENIEPSLNNLGYNIVKLSLYNYGKNNTLQIMIEKISGESVSINDCEKISKEISVILDIIDPVKKHYILEVSSAGINRPLVKIKDYIKYCGQNILLKTYVPKENKKIFKGKLHKADEKKIVIILSEPLSNGDNFIELMYDEISSAQLDKEIKFK